MEPLTTWIIVGIALLLALCAALYVLGFLVSMPIAMYEAIKVDIRAHRHHAPRHHRVALHH